MNKEIIKIINYLSPDDPSRSVDYTFSQWSMENFDKLSTEKVLLKISEMIDDIDSGVCLQFGRQWVQSNKSKIIDGCRNILEMGEESPGSPEPKVRESFKYLKTFEGFTLGRDVKVIIPTPSGDREILAKVDTGAFSTSIDESLFKSLNLDEKIMNTKVVRNVHGEEKRDVYEIDIVVNGKNILSELNVFDRGDMKYKMIIGRKDIQKLDAVVDVQKEISKFENFNEEINLKNSLIAGVAAATIAGAGIAYVKNYDKANLEKTEKIGQVSFREYSLSALAQGFNVTISNDNVTAAHWDETEDDGEDSEGRTKTKTVDYYGITVPEGTKEVYVLMKFWGGFYASTKQFTGADRISLSEKTPTENNSEYTLYNDMGFFSGINYIVVNKKYHDGEEFTLSDIVANKGKQLQSKMTVGSIYPDVYIFGYPKGAEFSGGGAGSEF